MNGCGDPRAANYMPTLASEPGFASVSAMCQFPGCNDTEATNYDSTVC